MDKEIKDFISAILIFTILFIILVLGLYACNLSGNGLSKDPEQWGQFGDYVGGILNPILTILNLVLVSYLTLKIVHIEEARSKDHLHENVKPLGLFSFNLSEDSLKIDIHNVGLGPLIMVDFKIFNENKTIKDFDELVKSIQFEYHRPTYSFNRKPGTDNVIRKDDFINIFDISLDTDKDDPNYLEKLNDFNKIKEEIFKYKISITYTDLYRKNNEVQEEDLKQLKY